MKVPRSNLAREQRTALKELKGLRDEMILATSGQGEHDRDDEEM